MTRTVRVSDEVYEILSKERIEGENLSDVIHRISKRKPSLLEFAGAWKDIPEEEFQRMKEAIKSLDQPISEVFKKIDRRRK